MIHESDPPKLPAVPIPIGRYGTIEPPIGPGEPDGFGLAGAEAPESAERLLPLMSSRGAR
jgi:hypothetical protein